MPARLNGQEQDQPGALTNDYDDEYGAIYIVRPRNSKTMQYDKICVK